MPEEDIRPSGRALRPVCRCLRETVGSLLESKRTTRANSPSHVFWPTGRDGNNNNSNMDTEYMTIKQKIIESSKPSLANGSSSKRATLRLSYLKIASPRSSSSSEDSSHSSSPDDAPYIDQPFRDGRRRKICHACFGRDEHIDMCNSCCFERPAGCRDCNWTGWDKCAACVGPDHAVQGRPFGTGSTRVPLVGNQDQKHRLGSWGLRQMLGTTA